MSIEQQKVAVITGASQGIGAGLVRAYREAGYRVVANSRSIQPSDDPDILTLAGDIALPQVAERVIAEGFDWFGRIDTLVNNAGVFPRHLDQDVRHGRPPHRREIGKGSRTRHDLSAER